MGSSGIDLTQIHSLCNYLNLQIEDEEQSSDPQLASQMTVTFPSDSSIQIFFLFLPNQKLQKLRIQWSVPDRIRDLPSYKSAIQSNPSLHESLVLWDVAPKSLFDCEQLITLAMQLHQEIGTHIEAITSEVSMKSTIDARGLLEQFDDLLLTHPNFTKTHMCNYERNSPEFIRHRIEIELLNSLPESLVMPQSVSDFESLILITESKLLVPIDRSLENQLLKDTLVNQIIDIWVILTDRGMYPGMNLFRYKPMSLQVVISPVYVSPGDIKEFSTYVIQNYWGLLVQRNSQQVSTFNPSDYLDRKLFGEAEVMKYHEVREYEGHTLWKLHVRFLSVFQLFLWKHYTFLPRNLPASCSDSSLDVDSMFVREAAEFQSTGELTGDSEGTFNQPEFITGVRRATHRSFLRPSGFSHVPSRNAEGFLEFNQCVLVESLFEGLFSYDNRNIRYLPDLQRLLTPLHQQNQFHGLLTPSTIRIRDAGELVLSLTAFTWPMLHLLYYAIPESERDLIAPEVKAVCEQPNEPVEGIDFSKADTYGLSMVILLYGTKMCKECPELADVVLRGKDDNWRNRPRFEDVCMALRKAMG